MESIAPGAVVTGRALQRAVALLTLRFPVAMAPEPGRAAVLSDCAAAELAELLEVLEVMTAAMLVALPDEIGRAHD